jgi:hypothetical protein
MSRMDRYWRDVAETRATLPKVVFLTSTAGVDGRVAGVVMEADRETAARALVDGTHRVATEAEVSANNAAAERSRRLLGARVDAATGNFNFERK